MNPERVYGDYLEDILDALVKVGQFLLSHPAANKNHQSATVDMVCPKG